MQFQLNLSVQNIILFALAGLVAAAPAPTGKLELGLELQLNYVPTLNPLFSLQARTLIEAASSASTLLLRLPK
jgi:hypothetical protein